MVQRFKFIVPLVLFICTLGFTFNNKHDYALVSFFLMFAFIGLLVFDRNNITDEDGSAFSTTISKTPYNVYYGDELNFNDEMIIQILNKHFPYFVALNPPQKSRFLKRLNAFMRLKTFKIHDNQGFKEMPVLVSAAAVQLSFGFENYLLPQFEFIHVYPQEFVHKHAAFSLLEGNVSGQSINISWKHFLEGYQYPNDGQNVGLHEMAHAYYYQNFVCSGNIETNFVSSFPHFSETANKVFELEKAPGNDLYSDYAMKNFQEFWAESIEIFFEKPADMNNAYPDLYTGLKSLLNQDPLNYAGSMIR